MARRLTTLLKDVRACTLCADLPLGPRPVVQASTTARILVAGQAPGTRVHETGIPFNDPSGDRLRAWMGVDRETFYDQKLLAIVPMGFCYPGRGSSGDLPPRSECAPAWRQRILDELPGLSLILAIGQYAQAWHLKAELKRKNVTETVRAWQTCDDGLIPLPHPSPRNNLWLKKNPWFESELLPVLKTRIQTALEA